MAKTEPSPASAPASFLTKANWTPDIVASLLASSAGMFLGGALAFLHLFIPYGNIIAGLLVLLAAALFANTCRHMELEGRRFMQQAYLLLIPLLVIFLAVVLIIQVLLGLLLARLRETMATQSVGGIPLSQTGLIDILPRFSGVANATGAGLMTVLFTLLALLPFLVIAYRRRWLRWWHLLPALLPIALGLWLMAAGFDVRAMLPG